MVTMTVIWDRTAEVLRGRGSMLAGIAALLIFLPSVVQDAMQSYAGKTPGAMALGGLIGVIVAALAIWGNLALVAAVSDPLVDRDGALAIGRRRLGAGVGLGLLLALMFGVALVPALALLIAAGVSPTAFMARSAGGAPDMTGEFVVAPGLAALAGLYGLIVVVVAIAVSARLALFWPVLVNERRGVGSFRRSFDLTRGLTWRIIGVGLLFVIVLLVAMGAAQLVASVTTRLLLGPAGEATARFVGAVVGGAVAAAGTVVSTTFVTQLYRVVTGREAAAAFS